MATAPRHPSFYARYGNPRKREFEDAVVRLEGGEAALATASGMAATVVAILGMVKQGEHIVAQSELYEGMLGFLKNIVPRLGIEVSFVDQTEAASFVGAT